MGLATVVKLLSKSEFYSNHVDYVRCMEKEKSCTPTFEMITVYPAILLILQIFCGRSAQDFFLFFFSMDSVTIVILYPFLFIFFPPLVTM